MPEFIDDEVRRAAGLSLSVTTQMLPLAATEQPTLITAIGALLAAAATIEDEHDVDVLRLALLQSSTLAARLAQLYGETQGRTGESIVQEIALEVQRVIEQAN